MAWSNPAIIGLAAEIPSLPQWADWLAMGGCLLGMTVIGWLCMSRSRGGDEFLMGGRRRGRMLIGMTAMNGGAGDAGLAAAAGAGFAGGLGAVWMWAAWLAMLPAAWLLGPWIRRMRYGSLGEFFAERYQSPPLGALYAIFGLAFSALSLAMLLSVSTRIIGPLLGVDGVKVEWFSDHVVGLEFLVIPGLTFLILLHVLMGGARAVIWNQLLTGLLGLGLTGLLIHWGLARAGGAATLTHWLAPAWLNAGGSWLADYGIVRALLLGMLLAAGAALQPGLVWMAGAARTEQAARGGLLLGFALRSLLVIGWVVIGMLILTLLPQAADAQEMIAGDGPHVMGGATGHLLGMEGQGLRGLGAAWVLLMTASGAGLILMSGAAMAVKSLYIPFLNPNANEGQQLAAARAATFVLAIAAAAYSLYQADLMQMLRDWWTLPALFAAPFWLGLFWRRATPLAAWITLICCFIIFLVLPGKAGKYRSDLTVDSRFTTSTLRVETIQTRPARVADAVKRRLAIKSWDEQYGKAVESLKVAQLAYDREMTTPVPARSPLPQGTSVDSIPAPKPKPPVTEVPPVNPVPPVPPVPPVNPPPVAPPTAPKPPEAAPAKPPEKPADKPADQSSDIALPRPAAPAAPSVPHPKWLDEPLKPAPASPGLHHTDKAPVEKLRTLEAAYRQLAEARLTIDRLGPRPAELKVGQPFDETRIRGGQPIFWTGALTPLLGGAPLYKPLSTAQPHGPDGPMVVVKRLDGPVKAQGNLRLELLPLRWLPVDIEQLHETDLEIISAAMKLLGPMLLMFLMSLLTPRVSAQALDRFHIKMKSKVMGDALADSYALDLNQRDGSRLARKTFGAALGLELPRPTWMCLAGVAGAAAIIGLLVWGVMQLSRHLMG